MSTSLFTRAIHPAKQFVVFFGFFILYVLVVYVLQKTEAIDPNPTMYWEGSFTTLMIYIIFSSALSFSYPSKTKYFMSAIICFVVLMVTTGFLALYFSGQHIDVGGAGSFRWMFMMLTFSYLVLLTIVNSMFKILEFVKKQDARLRGEEE